MTEQNNGHPPLPAGWQWARLGKFIRHTKDFFIINDDEEYQLVTVKLHGRGIVPRDRLFGSQIQMKQQQRIRAGQLLVAEIDAKVGAFGIVPKELEGAIVSGHYFLYDFISDDLLPEYLEAYIIANLLTKKIQQSVRGSLNYAAIRPTHVLEIPLLIPQPDVQRHMAADVKITQKMQLAAERQLEALNALPSKLIEEVIGDFVQPENLL